MSNVCTPIFVGMASLVSETLAKFPFWTMDCSPWSSKNLIVQNWLKKFMQVGIDVKCMHTNFGQHGFSGFGDLSHFRLPSKTAKFPFQTMGYSPWSSKNLIVQNQLKKFMQVGIDVKCMHTDFGGHGLSGFGDIANFKNGQISLSDHGLWTSKNLIIQNWLKKFMQVGIDVKCMHTNFGRHGLSGFGDLSHFRLPSKTAKFPFRTMDYSPWSSKNLINQNWLKKFMQVGIDVKCRHTNFDGVASPISEILLLSKTVKFPFQTMDYSPWGSKNRIGPKNSSK